MLSGFSFRYSRKLRPRLWLPQRGLVQRGSDFSACRKLSQPPSWVPSGAIVLPISRPDSLRISDSLSLCHSYSTARLHRPSCSAGKETAQRQPSDSLRRPGMSNALRAPSLQLRQRHGWGNARSTVPSVHSFQCYGRIWGGICRVWELVRASISSTSTWEEEQTQWVSALSGFFKNKNFLISAKCLNPFNHETLVVVIAWEEKNWDRLIIYRYTLIKW